MVKGTRGEIVFINPGTVEVRMWDKNEVIIIPLVEMDEYFDIIGVFEVENSDIKRGYWE